MQDLVSGQTLDAFIWLNAQIHRSPKSVVRNLVGISLMVGILVMQSMTVHPGNRIYIDGKDVIRNGDGLNEPFLIVQTPDGQFPYEGRRPNTTRP